jgi:hypothetical protein
VLGGSWAEGSAARAQTETSRGLGCKCASKRDA